MAKNAFFCPKSIFSFIFNNFVTIMMGHQKGKHSWKKVILTMGSWFWGEFFPIFWVRITEKRLFFCFAETWKLAKNPFSTMLIIWEKGTFFFGQHCPVVAGTWLGVRNEFFLGDRNFGILARKSVLCYRTPINGMFIALGVTVVLAPLDQFLNFTFRSYGCFCGGDPSHAAKSITPPHCRGTWVP